MEPVFFVYENKSEYFNVKNWTNARLHDTIKLESDSNEKHKSLYLRMKSARKEPLTELYKEIQQLIDNESWVFFSVYIKMLTFFSLTILMFFLWRFLFTLTMLCTKKGTAFSFSAVLKYKFIHHWCTQQLESCLPLILFLCPQPIQNLSLWVK